MIVATIQSASQSKAPSGLIVRNAFGPIELCQPRLDLGQENEPFYHVIDRGMWRHCLEGFDNAIAREWLLHIGLVMQIRELVEPPSVCQLPD